MSVELDPQELGFQRPFTREVSRSLRLSNPHSQPVAFKVKTTAPKQYCVRPNSGKIDAGSAVEVQVLLQAMREDPPLDVKCRDKFLVQSVSIGHDQAESNIPSVWAEIEKTSKGSIQEKKIRVVFLPPDTAGAVSTPVKSHVNGTQDEDLSQASPSMAAFTPSAHSGQAATTTETVKETVKSAASNVAGTAQTAASTVVAAVPTSQDQLNRQLTDAKAQIEQLKQQLESGLRQRKADLSGEKSPVQAVAQKMEQAPGGVPVQIVAALCLVSFILAWLFF